MLSNWLISRSIYKETILNTLFSNYSSFLFHEVILECGLFWVNMLHLKLNINSFFVRLNTVTITYGVYYNSCNIQYHATFLIIDHKTSLVHYTIIYNSSDAVHPFLLRSQTLAKYYGWCKQSTTLPSTLLRNYSGNLPFNS